jgi:hypothetical protein
MAKYKKATIKIVIADGRATLTGDCLGLNKQMHARPYVDVDGYFVGDPANLQYGYAGVTRTDGSRRIDPFPTLGAAVGWIIDRVANEQG